MKKLSKEIKISLLVITGSFLFYFGLRFMNFGSVWSNSKHYYVFFNRIDGLSKNAPVYIKGFKVGSVVDISLDQNLTMVLVVIKIYDDEVELKKNTLVELYDSSFITGTKAIKLIFLDENAPLAEDKDTLQSRIEEDLFKIFDKQIGNSFSNIDILIANVNSSVLKINELLSKNNIEAISSAASDISLITKDMSKIFAKLNDQIVSENGTFSKSLKNVESITEQIESAHLKETLESLNSISIELNAVISKMNKGEGTVGQLLVNEDLYNNLNQTTITLNNLLKDIETRPNRYTNFSIFEKKDK